MSDILNDLIWKDWSLATKWGVNQPFIIFHMENMDHWPKSNFCHASQKNQSQHQPALKSSILIGLNVHCIAFVGIQANLRTGQNLFVTWVRTIDRGLKTFFERKKGDGDFFHKKKTQGTSGSTGDRKLISRKKGAKTFFEKKGGGDFFRERKKGRWRFFERKKGGEDFFREKKREVKIFLREKKGGRRLFSRKI